MRRRALLLAGVVLVAAVAFLALTRDDDGPSRDEVLRYQDDIVDLARRWGRIEVQGMRPAIADLRTEGEGVPAVTIAGEARAWHSGLSGIREELRDVDVPDGLEAVALGFDDAMGHYLDAARTFESAAEAAPPRREPLIERGVSQVRRGAARYNEASMLLQDARRRVGLPPTDDFPDQPAEVS